VQGQPKAKARASAQPAATDLAGLRLADKVLVGKSAVRALHRRLQDVCHALPHVISAPEYWAALQAEPEGPAAAAAGSAALHTSQPSQVLVLAARVLHELLTLHNASPREQRLREAEAALEAASRGLEREQHCTLAHKRACRRLLNMLAAIAERSSVRHRGAVRGAVVPPRMGPAACNSFFTAEFSEEMCSQLRAIHASLAPARQPAWT